MATPYFSSLIELDAWAAGSVDQEPSGVLEYVARPPPTSEIFSAGKLLVCHDYKGGYTESPASLSYTFNFWSSCDIFVYFSHHRVTIPPPGWITAAHRQGVKILGTLIFEGGGEEDCLRLIVGNAPHAIYGPAKSTSATAPFPLSPHYAILLAELARQRGFDGYLLNFECPLRGGIEQSRTLDSWITLLRSEVITRVGGHGETIWYDSVTFSGALRWQDRLNSLNLPFFLSSSGIFTNYTWPPHYPNTTAQYFVTLGPELIGDKPGSGSQVAKKSLNDIYMGVDVWGRGTHGGGGFGSYKAISHIAPESLGLSVALFGPAWTWESEQDKPGWDWDTWWEYESKLWVGPVSGGVGAPEAPRTQNELECPHGPFQSISSFFPHKPPPDPLTLPFHSMFSPGVGRSWFVKGVKVHQTPNGWTDINKQCSVGDLVWPRPLINWEDKGCTDPLPDVSPSIYFEDAWNGGSSLKLKLSSKPQETQGDSFWQLWIPVQSVALTRGRRYEASLYYKVESPSQVELDLSFSVKLHTENDDAINITPISAPDSGLPSAWSQLLIQLDLGQGAPENIRGDVGLLIALISESPLQALDMAVYLGQVNIYGVPPPASAVHSPKLLWAKFDLPKSEHVPGKLSWESGASFPPLTRIPVTSPDDPIPAWAIHTVDKWFPRFLYFNVYALLHTQEGSVGPAEDAIWIGTTGLDATHQSLAITPKDLPFWSKPKVGTSLKVRFYVQGVTEQGLVLEWDKCVFVDCDLASLLV